MKKDKFLLEIVFILFIILDLFKFYTFKEVKVIIRQKVEPKQEWNLICSNVEATIYNASKQQCNDDCFTTASNFKLNIKYPEKHRIIAIERTMMKKYNIKMGDVVKICGTQGYDGLWRVEDKMNSRFKNKNKIDFLVSKTKKYGKWKNVKMYILNDKINTDLYLADNNRFLPENEL